MSDYIPTNEVEALYQSAVGLFARGHFGPATENCRRALEAKPDHGASLQLLSNIYLMSAVSNGLNHIGAMVKNIELTAGAAGLDALLASDRYAEPGRVMRQGFFKAYSQSNEDGIIHEIFSRIGTTNKTFVEFGVDTGVENNTNFLLLQGWRGLWIEASESGCQAIAGRMGRFLQSRQLTLLNAFITRDNINQLIAGAGVSGEIDLLSVDIDGNDYYVHEQISCIAPRVVVAEYNARFSPYFEWKMDYDPNYVWDKTIWVGVSLKALERLYDKLGYYLVGCSINGGNAFFVRKDLAAAHFAAPFTAENHYEPERVWATYALATYLQSNIK